MFGPSLLSILSWLVFFTGVFLTWFAWPRRFAKGAKPYLIRCSAISVTVLCEILERSASSLGTKMFWRTLGAMSLNVNPIAHLALALDYTDLGRKMTRKKWLLVLAVPIVVFILLATDGLFHGYFVASQLVQGELELTRGAGFFLLTGYSYLLEVTYLVLLGRTVIQTRGLARWQAFFLAISTGPAWIGMGLFIANERMVGLFYIGSILSGLIIAWAIFGLRAFDFVPIARKKVIEYLADPMVVIDSEGRIADLNPAAQSLLGWKVSKAMGKCSAEVLAAWPEVLRQLAGEAATSFKVFHTEGEAQRSFEVRVSLLVDSRGELNGRLVHWRPEIDAKAVLSLGELRVVEMLTLNLSNKEISSRLGVSVNTVKFHLNNIFRKTGATNRAQVVHRVSETRSGARILP